jgi:hypothetical protein
MKKILSILLLLLISISSFAQSLETEFLYYEGRSLGNDFNSKLSKSRKILELAEEISREKGINTNRIELKTRDGKSYPAIQISTFGSSEHNVEAKRVASSMSGLPLVFSPYDLSNGSSAFFDPDGSKIGVPYNFFVQGRGDSSYLHELYHAGTFHKILRGEKTVWAGVMKVTKGTYISEKNSDYYFRFASLDEIIATALSLKLNSEELSELQKVLTPADFYRSRGAADKKINEIYLSAVAGKYLAKQSADVARRALLKVNQSVTAPHKLTLGKTTRNIYATTFSLDSYEREYQAGRSFLMAINDGLIFTMYSTSKPSISELSNRLNQIISKSTASEKLFTDAEKKIYVLIEFAQLDRSDLPGLYSVAPLPFRSLQ